MSRRRAGVCMTMRNVKVGDIFAGRVSNVMPYGVFVQFGAHSGLCHASGIPQTIERAQLSVGVEVKVIIREIRSDKKLSLTLLEVQPHRATGGLLVGGARNYSSEIDSALVQGAADIIKIGVQFSN